MKLRIACAVQHAPGAFDVPEGNADWDIPKVGSFRENPRKRLTDADWELLNIYSQCDRGMSRMVYPDGGSMLDQPVLLLAAFSLIADARAQVRKQPDGG